MLGSSNLFSKKTVLYCVAIPTLVYPALMHRRTIAPETKAVIFIDKWEFERRTDIDAIFAMKENDIFFDVVATRMFVDKQCIDTAAKEIYLSHFDDVFTESGYSLMDFEEIYVLNDSWDGDINIYFNFKEISYTWINTVKDYVPNPMSPIPSFTRICLEEKVLTPYGKYAKPCVLPESEQIICELKRKQKQYTLWDKQSAYNNLTEDFLNKVGRCYRINEIGETSTSALLIKNSGGLIGSIAFKNWNGSIAGMGTYDYIRHLVGYNQFGMDNHTPFYDKIALDFFSPNASKIYVKEHPNCPINDIQQEIYNESIFSCSQIPFEFLIKYFIAKNIRFHSLIGYLSSSLLALDNSVCDNLFVLGGEFLRTSMFYSSLYTSLLYAKHCGFKTIYASDLNRSQLAHLLRTVDFSVDLQKLDFGQVGEYRDALILTDYVLDRYTLHSQWLERIHPSCAAAVMNVELTEDFFEDSLLPWFLPIDIQKEKVSEGFLNLQRDERIWIYTKGNPIMKATRSFTMEKLLPRCGLKLQVRERTQAEGAELFRACSAQRWAYLNHRQLEELTARMNTISGIVYDSCSKEQLTTLLQQETEVCRYIEILNLLKSHYRIFLSVRDTPGNRLPESALKTAQAMGFTRLSRELWRMYCGILDRGTAILDQTGEARELPVETGWHFKGLDVTMVSKAWRQGNQSAIILNGHDWSVNMRGLNIVVWDPETKTVIDSVGFDCHDPQFCFKRLPGIQEPKQPPATQNFAAKIRNSVFKRKN